MISLLFIFTKSCQSLSGAPLRIGREISCLNFVRLGVNKDPYSCTCCYTHAHALSHTYTNMHKTRKLMPWGWITFARFCELKKDNSIYIFFYQNYQGPPTLTSYLLMIIEKKIIYSQNIHLHSRCSRAKFRNLYSLDVMCTKVLFK